MMYLIPTRTRLSLGYANTTKWIQYTNLPREGKSSNKQFTQLLLRVLLYTICTSFVNFNCRCYWKIVWNRSKQYGSYNEIWKLFFSWIRLSLLGNELVKVSSGGHYSCIFSYHTLNMCVTRKRGMHVIWTLSNISICIVLYAINNY